MKKQELIDHVTNLAKKIADEMGYELWDVDYVKEGPDYYLKVFCDKEGGFTINDCVAMSHALDAQLEESDPVDNPYILEVSSPGLDRPLKKDRDFERSLGKLVDVKTYQPAGALGKSFQAVLKSYDEGTQTMTLTPEEGEDILLARKDVSSIRLAVVF